MSYVYLLTVDGIDRYVGKGTNRRLYYHEKHARSLNKARAFGQKIKTTKFYNRLAKAIREGATIKVLILVDNLSEDEAYQVETAEIAIRSDLWNDNAGGRGTTSPSLETRARISKSHERQQKRLDYFENKRRAAVISQETRDTDGRYERQKETNQTEETKAKRAKATADTWADEKSRAQRMASIKATANKPESRARLRQQMIDNLSDPVIRAKMIAASQPENRSPETTIKRKASLEAAWAERTAKQDAELLEFISNGPTVKELKTAFGRPVMGRIRKLLKRKVIERRGGYHDGSYHTI